MSGTVIQMQQQPVAASTLDGLPKQFVTAMRTLFDIMDDKRNGCVNFADIENRWQDDGSKGLPKGVIESLRKVTPPNGLLSFERFCAGLKICLLRNQVEQRNGVMGGGGGGNRGQGVPTDIVTLQQNRPPSAPLLDLDSPPPLPQSTTHPALINTKSHHNSHHNNPSTNHNNNLNKPPWPNTATIRPNINTAQRTLSMPQLVTDPHQLLRKDVSSNVVVTVPVIKDQQQHTMLPSSKPVPNVNKPVLYGPPKPPRTTLGALDRNNPTNNVMIDRTEIRNALQNWQLGLMEQDSNNKAEKAAAAAAAAAALRNGLLRTGRSLGDGSATQQQQQGTLAGSGAGPVVTSDGGGAMQMTGTSAGMYQKKANVRRREPRRHTLQNGIDYNMLKRMKQIEQEKEVLLQGLGAIEKAREWYMKQVAAVQDRMKYIGRMGHVEHWSEAQQERLELQRARVYEVNRHLAALTDSWERGGLPLHMNLAVQHYQHHSHPPQDLSTRLKQQNHLLTEEVGKKSERISVLEREKQSLIRELLQMRVPNRNSQEEAVF